MTTPAYTFPATDGQTVAVPQPATPGTLVQIVWPQLAGFSYTNISYTDTSPGALNTNAMLVAGTATGLKDFAMLPIGGGGQVMALTLNGTPGSGLISWTINGLAGTTGSGSMTVNYPGMSNYRPPPPVVAASSGSNLGRTLLIGGAVVGGGVAAAAIAGVATGNGAGWLFGLAGEVAGGAAEEVRRRIRRF